MAEILTREFVERRDRQLLAELHPENRELVQQVLANYPTLPLAEALQMLRAFGM